MIAVLVGNEYITNAVHAQTQAGKLQLGAFAAVYEEVLPFHAHKLGAGVAVLGWRRRRCAQNGNLKSLMHSLSQITASSGLTPKDVE